VSATPRLSVVFATYNRAALAKRLVQQLGAQSLPPESFEIVVVDDGSATDVAALLRSLDVPCPLQALTQANQGAAAARHHAVSVARGDIVVTVDDDMEIGQDFLAAHLKLHEGGPRRVVLGHIRPAAQLATMPIFERYHAEMLDRFVRGVESGSVALHGNDVCTGNVSFRRADYEAVGGFDKTLGRSEDADLGLRLEKAGCELLFSREAYTVHGSDHASLAVWMQRAYRYGIFDLRIAHKHVDLPWASPWRFFRLVHPLSRLPLALSVALPPIGRGLGRAAIAAALALDRLGAERVAVAGTTLAYGLLYFAGVRAEAGALRAALADWRSYEASL